MNMTPLEYGKQACDATMKRISPERLNPEGTLFYHQGVFLSGMQKIYELCGEKKYFQYVNTVLKFHNIQYLIFPLI